MERNLSERVAIALRELRELDNDAAAHYLRELRQSDSEVALKLDVMLWAQGSEYRMCSATFRDADTPAEVLQPRADNPTLPSGERPTGSLDAKATGSFVHADPVSPGADDGPLGSVTPFLGRYQLLRLVGRGAFGEVWQAHDPVLQKNVAVKTPFTRSGRPFSSTDFLQEARKAASLRHPAIVQVYDAGESGGVCYIVSEFVEGTSLRTRLEGSRLPFDQAGRIVATVAGALHVAHLAGLVHRDVKPANILLDQAGNAYLTDFGLAVREDEQFAERSKVSGTLAYMPPEQIRGDTHLLDGRADIYALGAVLYELLTGRLPFRAETYEGYLELILRREPRPPRSIATVPEELERICLKCLAKEVKDRYRTAQDLAADLEAWLASTQPPPPSARARLGLGSGWRPAIVGTLILFLLAGVGVIAILSGVDGSRTVATRPEPVPTPVVGPVVEPVVGPVRVEDHGRKVTTVKELLCVKKGSPFGWDVVEETNQLKVYTNTLSLLQLGEAKADSWEFSARVEQIGSPKWVGLFLGFRTDLKTVTASYELIQLVPVGEKVYLERSVQTYGLNDPFPSPKSTIYGNSSVKHLLREVNTIQLTVRDNRLAQVHLNDKAIPALSNVTVEPPADGPFGVYNQRSAGVFSGLLFNNKLIPLLAP